MDALERLKQWSQEASAAFRQTVGVTPRRWLQLEAQYRTLGACQFVLRPHSDSWWLPILTSTWEQQRLHWSVEAMALRPEFKELFTAEERAVARARLQTFGHIETDEQ